LWKNLVLQQIVPLFRDKALWPSHLVFLPGRGTDTRASRASTFSN